MRRRMCLKLILVIAVLSCSARFSEAQGRTVWHALGIPQSARFMRDSLSNRSGNRPNMERKPPVKRIADPANMQSDVPAIKTAADIKAQQDLAPQKIKALKYLAVIGCGCYGGVAEALAAALEDCTEEVRYEAAKALYQAIVHCKCDVCQKTCCTPELAAKMYERAYGRDESGCFLEPSERVRNMLAQVLPACPPDMRDIDDPIGTQLDPDPSPGTPVLPPDRAPGTRLLPPGVPRAAALVQPSIYLTRGGSGSGNDVAAASGQSAPAPSAPMEARTVSGQVVASPSRGFVRVMFPDGLKPALGTEVDVFHNYVLGMERVGRLIIVDYEGSHAIAGPRAWDKVNVNRGDIVECTVQVPVTPSVDLAPIVTPAEALPPQIAPAPLAEVVEPEGAKLAVDRRPVVAEQRLSVVAGEQRGPAVVEEQASGQIAPTHRGPSPVFIAPGEIAPGGTASEIVAPMPVIYESSIAEHLAPILPSSHSGNRTGGQKR